MNYITLKTLITKEIKRFAKIYNQTIFAPLVNAMLFYIVLTVAFGSNAANSDSHKIYIATGLTIMSMLQNAFANAQGSVSMSKVLGFIVDWMLPPITKYEIIISIVIASVIRAIVVGAVVYFGLSFFLHNALYSLWALVYFSIISCILFSMFGIIIGCLSDNFDTAHAYTSYLITPLTFLSGTFYSVHILPQFWQKLIMLNPVFYMIDGFRYSIMGSSESNIFVGSLVLLTLTFVTTVASIAVIGSKYKPVGM